MTPGSRVRFKSHGETGLVHTIEMIVADECAVRDPRGRILHRVPIELLEAAPPEPHAWREVDELEAY